MLNVAHRDDARDPCNLATSYVSVHHLITEKVVSGSVLRLVCFLYFLQPGSTLDSKHDLLYTPLSIHFLHARARREGRSDAVSERKREQVGPFHHFGTKKRFRHNLRLLTNLLKLTYPEYSHILQILNLVHN
jgi:hypothetical protein